MMSELLFIGGVAVFTAIVLWIIKKSKNNLQTKKSRVMDIVKAVGIVLALAVISLIVNTFFIKNSEAADLKLLDRGSVHAGLQYPLTDETNICTPGENQIASDLALQVDGVTYKDFIGIGGAYTHNSCAAGSDEDVYDGAGVYAFVEPTSFIYLQAGVDWNTGNSTVCQNDGAMFNGRANLEIFRYGRFSTGAGYTIHKCIDGPGIEYQGAGLYLQLDFWNR